MRLLKIVIFHLTLGFLNTYPPIFFFNTIRNLNVISGAQRYIRTPEAFSQHGKLPLGETFLWVFHKKRHEHILKILHFLSLRYSADFGRSRLVTSCKKWLVIDYSPSIHTYFNCLNGRDQIFADYSKAASRCCKSDLKGSFSAQRCFQWSIKGWWKRFTWTAVHESCCLYTRPIPRKGLFWKKRSVNFVLVILRGNSHLCWKHHRKLSYRMEPLLHYNTTDPQKNS